MIHMMWFSSVFTLDNILNVLVYDISDDAVAFEKSTEVITSEFTLMSRIILV